MGPHRARTQVSDLTTWLRDVPVPERLELRSSRRTAAFRLGLMLVPVPVGVLMIRDGQWMGWLVVPFFGPVAVLTLVLLIRGNRLVLTPAGMSTWSLRRSSHVRWEDARDFRPMRSPTPHSRPVTVGVDFDRTPDRGHPGGERREAVLNDTYGNGVEELCEFLESYRARSLRGRPRGGSHGARSSRPWPRIVDHDDTRDASSRSMRRRKAIACVAVVDGQWAP